jgi:hypothetical protein
MCDIYFHKCKTCNNYCEMHLGDFDTTQEEINVYCNDCSKKMPKNNFVLWIDSDGAFTIVESLTKNAWDNRGMNHPNIAYIKMVCIVPKSNQQR